MQAIDENNWSDEVEVLAMETEDADLLNQSFPGRAAHNAPTYYVSVHEPSFRLCQESEHYEHRSHRWEAVRGCVACWRSTK